MKKVEENSIKEELEGYKRIQFANLGSEKMTTI
jgi:hypothetical protein